jgi:hypothetical protein
MISSIVVARRSLPCCTRRVALGHPLKRQHNAPPRRLAATRTTTTTSSSNTLLVGSKLTTKQTLLSQKGRRNSSTTTTTTTTIWQTIRNRPIEYATIPCVAAFVGIMTNWMGVKMLFYPIEYFGTEWYREELSPYGYFGWQGTCVPMYNSVVVSCLQHTNDGTIRLIS